MTAWVDGPRADAQVTVIEEAGERLKITHDEWMTMAPAASLADLEDVGIEVVADPDVPSHDADEASI